MQSGPNISLRAFGAQGRCIQFSVFSFQYFIDCKYNNYWWTQKRYTNRLSAIEIDPLKYYFQSIWGPLCCENVLRKSFLVLLKKL